MRIKHEGTTPGAVLNTPEGDFEADDEGYFDVPDHLGASQVKFTGWSQFTGEVEQVAHEVGADLRAAVQAAHDRIDELETLLADEVGKLRDEIAKAVKAAPAKAPASKKAPATKDAEAKDAADKE